MVPRNLKLVGWNNFLQKFRKLNRVTSLKFGNGISKQIKKKIYCLHWTSEAKNWHFFEQRLFICLFQSSKNFWLQKAEWINWCGVKSNFQSLVIYQGKWLELTLLRVQVLHEQWSLRKLSFFQRILNEANEDWSEEI